MSQLRLDVPASLIERLSRMAAHQKKSVEQLAVEHLAALDESVSRSLEERSDKPRVQGTLCPPADVDRETQMWLDADLEGELPPYDWGDVDPLTLGHPVHYVPGVGLAIEREQMTDD